MTDDYQQIASTSENQLLAATAKKILLAEDDASVRKFLEVILQRAGYEVLCAEDGSTAIQKALENKFDMAVLDAVMPNMSGHDVVRILRGHPKFKDVPLIILSGLENQTDGEADLYLLKTANIQDQLLNAIADLLNKKS